jgi:thioesterase domain-containing protein
VQSGHANQILRRKHLPDVYDGDIVIFSARPQDESNPSHLQYWRPYVAGDITMYPVDCGHHDMLTTKSLNTYGEQLRRVLEA